MFGVKIILGANLVSQVKALRFPPIHPDLATLPLLTGTDSYILYVILLM